MAGTISFIGTSSSSSSFGTAGFTLPFEGSCLSNVASVVAEIFSLDSGFAAVIWLISKILHVCEYIRTTVDTISLCS